VAATLVTTRDARERRAGPEEGCVQADEREEDRLVLEAIGRAQLPPQVRRLSLGAVDADVLHQSSGQDPAEDATRAARGREAGAEAPVRQGLRAKPHGYSP